MSSPRKKNGRSAIVFICGESTKGAVEPVKGLLGRKVHSISGGDAALIALADDGIYTATDGTLLSCLEFSTASVGKSVIVGVTLSGSLYSWGTGEMGELGLGPTYTAVDEPKFINYNSGFTGVSAGATHCTALDSKGNAYAWGQNFDRQLGLYTKPLDEMQKLRANSSIEDLLFTPRFIPFSLSSPVRKIACGDAFTVAVTRDGALYTWGAGECGQLGTGRCTRRELPQQVTFPTSTTITTTATSGRIIDVACGSAHVLALSDAATIYAWGMNKRGQLGLGDTATRQQPCLLGDDISVVGCAQLYAHGHSSAALDDQGQLFTWGTTSGHRLMRWRRRRSIDDIATAVDGSGSQHCLRPGLVAAFRGMRVETFAFSATASACLVYTNIQGLVPLLGPTKGAQELVLRGYGLWDSDRVLIKFTHKQGLGQSRSCAGRFDASRGAIVCRPPRLVDAGFYDVQLAMDGASFQPEVHSYYAHKEVSALTVTPRLVDLRSAKAQTVTTTVRGLSVYPDKDPCNEEEEVGGNGADKYWPRESDLCVFVKLIVLCSPPGAVSASTSEVVVPGRLLPLPLLEMSSVLDGGASVAVSASSMPLGASVSQASLESVELVGDSVVAAPPLLQPITADRTVECVVDLASLGPPGSLLVIRTAVGLNGLDFGPATPELAPIICHSFQPVGATPCCCPADVIDEPEEVAHVSSSAALGSTSREITVVGNSFIPTTKLPPGTTIEAVVQAEFLAKKGDKKPTRVERCVPVECDVADTLTFLMPTLAEMLDPSVPITSSRPNTGAAPGTGSGEGLSRPSSQERLGSADAPGSAAGGSRPASQAGSVRSSASAAAPSELLCKVMFKMVSPAPEATTVPDSGAKNKGQAKPKSPTKAKDKKEEPVPLLSPEAVSVCLYQPQAVTVDPALTNRAGGATLVLQGTRKGGFTFSSSDVKVVFSRPDLGLELLAPAERTWMLGLDQEVPIDRVVDLATDEAAGGEDDGEGGAEAAATAAGDEPILGGGASLHGGGSVGSLGAGSLGELSVKSTGSVIANMGQPQKIVVHCGPFFRPRPSPAPVTLADNKEEGGGSLSLSLDALRLEEAAVGGELNAEGSGYMSAGEASSEGKTAEEAVALGSGTGSAEIGAGAGPGESEAKGGESSATEGGAVEARTEAEPEPEPQLLLPEKLDWVWVKVYLDGRSVVPDSDAFKLRLFDPALIRLSSEPLAVPKGGATAATPLVLPVLSGMVEPLSSGCMVRLRGVDTGMPEAQLQRVPGTVTLDLGSSQGADTGEEEAAMAGGEVDTGGSAGSVGFVLPDPAGLGVEPELRGKDRWLFVDMSLDGGESWVRAEEPLLQIK